ncbi:MAG: 3-oxoacyl-[acyl-carrier-protein] reductase [Pseudomonadota bacterium]
MFALDGKTALVTGASGGIGAAVARALAAGGARVALSGTRIERLEALAAEIGGDAAPFACDLSDADAPAGLPGQVEAAFGQLDIVVNNAGVTRDQLAMRMKPADWSAVLDINLTATFKIGQAALRGMMKRRWGRIINITSITGAVGNPGQVNYAAAKAGVVGWTKSMAIEVASRGVTVNCVAPGFIATAMTEGLSDDVKASINSRIPTGRMGAPEEIAGAVRYLASEEAAYVTGATLHVNGGLAML